MVAAQCRHRCESSTAEPFLTAFYLPSFFFFVFFHSHTYLSSSRCLGKSSVGVIKSGLFCDQKCIPACLLGKKKKRKKKVRLTAGSFFRVDRRTSRKHLMGTSGGGGFSQTALAHLEWKATQKCLLICVPGAQKPTKDQVASCKHTTVSRGFVICPVFSLTVRPFVARNKHGSVVRSRVNICVQIAARLPEGHCEEHLLQSSQSCTCSGLIGPQRTEAQFKSRAQVFYFLPVPN